jgi:PncC family amidohydrolase
MQKIINILKKKKLKITTAESCTGGMLAAEITKISGASDVFDCAFITYSNDAKSEVLGVSKSILKNYGAVSSQVAKAMAEGALKKSKADIAISITGIAGPLGATKTKPVGLVYIALAAKKSKTETFQNNFKGDRDKVRKASVRKSIQILKTHLKIK